jgi:hypothetical protein
MKSNSSLETLRQETLLRSILILQSQINSQRPLKRLKVQRIMKKTVLNQSAVSTMQRKRTDLSFSEGSLQTFIVRVPIEPVKARHQTIQYSWQPIPT